MDFKKKTRPQDREKIQEKQEVLKNLYSLFEGREKILDAFESKIFPIKTRGPNYLNLQIL